MKTAFRSSFARDLKKIEDRAILQQVRKVIEEIELAVDLRSISKVKKISGVEGCYRIRISDYRIGLIVEGDEVEFVRCLHRREIYRYFP